MPTCLVKVTLANSEDQDQTPRVTASDLGLHCLHKANAYLSLEMIIIS